MFGTLLLATWTSSFSSPMPCSALSDVQCGEVVRGPAPGAGLDGATLKDLASLEPERVGSGCDRDAELMGKLTQEFATLRAETRATLKWVRRSSRRRRRWRCDDDFNAADVAAPTPPAAPMTVGMEAA